MILLRLFIALRPSRALCMFIIYHSALLSLPFYGFQREIIVSIAVPFIVW